MLERGNFVDDDALVSYSNFLIYSRFRKTALHESEITRTVSAFESHAGLGVVCAIQVLAKYGDPRSILALARRNHSFVSRNFWAARSFAGTFPRFYGLREFSDFVDVLRSFRNEQAESVFNFHNSVATIKSAADKILPFLRKPNDSLATKILFSKALLLLSTKHNSAFSASYVIARGNHAALLRDPYFRALGF
jgi:hypothetical protein